MDHHLHTTQMNFCIKTMQHHLYENNSFKVVAALTMLPGHIFHWLTPKTC